MFPGRPSRHPGEHPPVLLRLDHPDGGGQRGDGLPDAERGAGAEAGDALGRHVHDGRHRPQPLPPVRE